MSMRIVLSVGMSMGVLFAIILGISICAKVDGNIDGIFECESHLSFYTPSTFFTSVYDSAFAKSYQHTKEHLGRCETH